MSGEVQNCVYLSAAIKPRRERESERERTLFVFITFTLHYANQGVSNTNHFGSLSDSLSFAFFTSFWSPNYAMQINALSI